ncbi:hypothetical protein [Tsuneonella sp. HG222]
MTRTTLLAAACLLLGGCVMNGLPGANESGPERELRNRLLGAERADPSKVIAAELAFARAAREIGQWTAFRQFATSDAVMPAPNPRPVAEVLKGRADPAQVIVWEPDLVWASCDGSHALSTGPATYPDGSKGRFATIWQRQGRSEYRWVLDQGFDLEDGYAKPDLIAAHIADCPPGTPAAGNATTWPDRSSGQSRDASLTWETRFAPDCARTFIVRARVEGEMREVFRREAAAPPVPAGRDPVTCPAR